MLEITNIRHGTVLTRFHGQESEEGLTVTVEGFCDPGREMLVNGLPAECSGRRFRAPVRLTEQFNTITASSVGSLGEYTQSIKVVWDKKSFKRYNFYIDDHIFLFTDLARQRPRRAFDHFYLKRLKEIHERFGFKVTLNCFFHNDHQEFTLAEMPDCYRSEFASQSDWLKFSFHSRSEFPDRPYEEVTLEEFCADYDLVQEHLIRICGAEAFIAPINVHWGALQPACAQEFIRRGSRCSCCTMRPFVSGGPSANARRGRISDITAVQQAARIKPEVAAFGSEYFFRPEEDSYLLQERKYYNFELGIFIARGCVCCNLVPLAETPGRLQQFFTMAEGNGNHIFGAASHEQYSFPYYANYLPDHLDRIELAVRQLTEYGCRPVFFSQGLLGNPIWE